MAMVTYSVFPSPSSSSSSSSSSSLDSPLLLRRRGLPTIWTPFLSNETLPLLKTNKCHQLRGKQAETKWYFLPFLRGLEGGNDQRWSLGLVKFRLDHLNKSTSEEFIFSPSSRWEMMMMMMSDDDEWWPESLWQKQPGSLSQGLGEHLGSSLEGRLVMPEMMLMNDDVIMARKMKQVMRMWSMIQEVNGTAGSNVHR